MKGEDQPIRSNQPTVEKPERISMASMNRAMLESFNLDRGLGYTMKSLAVNPRKAIFEYLHEDRKRMVHPVRLLLLSTAIAAFLGIQFVFNEAAFYDGFSSEVGDDAFSGPIDTETVAEIRMGIDRMINVFRNFQNIFLLAFVPLLAFMNYCMLRSRGLFFGEHLAIASYVVSGQNALFIVMIPLMGVNDQWAKVYLLGVFAFGVYMHVKIFAHHSLRSVLTVVASVTLAHACYYAGLVVVMTAIVLYAVSL